jgi:hypothetical protein
MNEAGMIKNRKCYTLDSNSFVEKVISNTLTLTFKV